MSKRRIALLTFIFVATTITTALLFPIDVHATVVKGALIPTILEPFFQTLAVIDHSEIHLSHLNVTWTQTNINYTITITSASFWAWQEEYENESGTIIYLSVENFTLATKPFVIDAHFTKLTLTLHIHLEDGKYVYDVEVVRKTNLLTLLAEWRRGEFYVR